MKISIYKYVVNLLIFICYAIFSYFFSTQNIWGDQLYYADAYNYISQNSISDAYAYYVGKTSGTEPVYFMFIWLFSRIFEKNILMSIVNGIFAVAIYNVLRKYQLRWIILALLSINFYLMVLFFSAERLKFSFLFLFLFMGAQGYWRYIYSFAALLSHYQMGMMYISLFLGKLRFSQINLNQKFTYNKSFIFLLKLVFSVIFVGGVGFLLFHNIYDKVLKYSQDSQGFAALIKPLVFLFLSLIYARKKTEAILTQLPLLLFSFLIGSDRVVIFSYLIFLSFALKVNRGLNIGVVLSSCYFFGAGIFFLENTLIFGDGFGPITKFLQVMQ